MWNNPKLSSCYLNHTFRLGLGLLKEISVKHHRCSGIFMVGGRYLCQHFQFRNAQKLIFQPQRLVFRTFCSICEYLGPPSQPPCFYYGACALTVMKIEYTCVHEQQWCVCWWLNPNQSLVESVRHYI